MVPRTNNLTSVQETLNVLSVLYAFSNAERAQGAGGWLSDVWRSWQKLNC